MPSPQFFQQLFKALVHVVDHATNQNNNNLPSQPSKNGGAEAPVSTLLLGPSRPGPTPGDLSNQPPAPRS